MLDMYDLPLAYFGTKCLGPVSQYNFNSGRISLTVWANSFHQVTGLLNTEGSLTLGKQPLLTNCACIMEPDGRPDLTSRYIRCDYRFVERDHAYYYR